MKTHFLLLLILLPLSIAISQTKAPRKAAPAQRETTLATQTWSTTNLSTDHFCNGDPIPEARTEAEWKEANAAHSPAWCYYRNEASRAATYGKLYNWYAVADPRRLAPAGWHLPTEGEWKTLIDGLGGETSAGPQLRNGSFKGIAGSCRYSFGTFNEQTGSSYWWTSTGNDAGGIAYRISSEGALCKENHEAGDGLSVRCLRD